MAEKENKKRKRPSNDGIPANKRIASTTSNSNGISIQLEADSGKCPVLLSSPGLTPPRIPFRAFIKPSSTKSGLKHDLLLHSTEHPRLDYTASPSSLDQHISHYVAVFDPSTQKLHITPAHSLSLRSTLRTEPQAERSKGTIGQQRADLGREFGTKKAKKAIADRDINAIKDTPGKNKEKVQDAILGAMAGSLLPTLDEKAKIEAALESKPIPKPNLNAEDVDEIYPFDTLIPPEIARIVAVKEWQDKARAGEKMEFFHQYPAQRVTAVGKGDDIQRLKALRYITLLLSFNDALQNNSGGKKVPKREVLKEKLSGWSDKLVDSVRRRFANPQNELTKWHLDNFYTHICAIALYIDRWTMDIAHLRQGLKMENKDLVQYFRELGCKVALPTESERESLNRWMDSKMKPMSKQVAAATRVVKLRNPPDFPKVRVGRRK